MSRNSASENGRPRPKSAATPQFPGDSPAPTSEAFEKTRGRSDQTSPPSPAPPPPPATLLEVFLSLASFLWNSDSGYGVLLFLTSLASILQMKLTQLRIRSPTPSRVGLFEFGSYFAYKLFVEMHVVELMHFCGFLFCNWVLLLVQHCKPGRLTVGNAFLLMGSLWIPSGTRPRNIYATHFQGKFLWSVCLQNRLVEGRLGTWRTELQFLLL